jgi:hypothetical protein
VTPLKTCIAAGLGKPDESVTSIVLSLQEVADIGSELLADTVINQAHMSGFTSYAYRGNVVLRAWQLAQTLASGSTLLRVVTELALQLSLSESVGEQVRRAVAADLVHIPSREVLRKVSLRLKFLNIQYQPEVNQKFADNRHLHADASKQGAYYVLVLIEDKFQWLVGMPPEGVLGQSPRCYKRFLPTTTLGLGAANLNYKLGNITHAILLEIGTVDCFNKFRYEVRSWTSYQGLEFEICDGPNLAFHLDGWASTLCALRAGSIDVRSPELAANFLFPNCLGVADLLHILFNGLEMAATSVESWQSIEDHFHSIAKFLGDLGLRRRFQATCFVVPEKRLQRALFNDCRFGSQFTWK